LKFVTKRAAATVFEVTPCAGRILEETKVDPSQETWVARELPRKKPAALEESG
jgi:hypothetical protein